MYVCSECGESYPGAGFCSGDGTSLEAIGADPLLGETISGYRVARLIGVGGMGRVYKGVNPQIGSRVAIKVLSRDCAENQELVERFFAEAKAVNVIRHENIVNVLSLDRLPDRRPFIIMEYLDGRPLSKIIGERGPLPLGSFARIIGEALTALGAAHSAGIIHRDLKPDNIFVTPHGRAKVLDFGIAKLTGAAAVVSAQTRDGSLMGTPHYMAPEQAMARAIDPRTDIYAMGVILYEGVTGEQPFQADALYDLLRMHVERAPPEPRRLRADLPAEYEAVILRALAKHPDQRQQSAKELYRDLANATRQLGENAWEPIGEEEDRLSVGMSSVPTPAGPPTPSAPHHHHIGGQTPQRVGPAPSEAPPLSQQPTPQASGQAFGRPTPTASRGPLIAILVGCAALAIGAGVFVAVDAADDDDPKTPEQPIAEADPDAGAEVVGQPNNVGAHPQNGQIVLPSNGTQNLDWVTTANEIGTADWPMDKAFAGRRHTPDVGAHDVTGFIPKATELAKMAFQDAILTRIDALGVRPNGKADMTLGDNFYVIYRFVSPSKLKRPDDLPLGVEHNPVCGYIVMLMKDFTMYHTEQGWCDWGRVGPPKCSATELWRKAARKGAPTGNVVAQLGYWAQKQGEAPRWLFMIGEAHSMWLPDDC